MAQKNKAPRRIAATRAAQIPQEQDSELRWKYAERAAQTGPARALLAAVIESGESVEIETDTHIVTITATPK